MTEEQRLEAEILGQLPTPTVPPPEPAQERSGSRESVPSASGGLWSLLPIHTPTAQAGSSSFLGGAR